MGLISHSSVGAAKAVVIAAMSFDRRVLVAHITYLELGGITAHFRPATRWKSLESWRFDMCKADFSTMMDQKSES
jgi:hypothetical protein